MYEREKSRNAKKEREGARERESTNAKAQNLRPKKSAKAQARRASSRSAKPKKSECPALVYSTVTYTVTIRIFTYRKKLENRSSNIKLHFPTVAKEMLPLYKIKNYTSVLNFSFQYPSHPHRWRKGGWFLTVSGNFLWFYLYEFIFNSAAGQEAGQHAACVYQVVKTVDQHKKNPSPMELSAGNN